MPIRQILLTVSGQIPPAIEEDIAAQRRPRADFLELARRLEADLMDYGKARERTGVIGRALEKLVSPNLMLAYACWLSRKQYRVIVTDGEQVGLPLAILSKVSRGRRPHHIMITHVISAAKKVLLIDGLRLTSQIDTFVVYSEWQRDFICRRWNLDPDDVCLIPFMVDEEFFDPSKVTRQMASKPRICSVGLERRDYPTLLKAVEGLDVEVVVAAASPWSKQRDGLSGQRLPPNVTVRKLTQYELRQLYADCDLLVMPLQAVDFQAGITAILEAMAMEKPVICSRTPGQTDVIVEGFNGAYVPVGDPAALRAEITRFLVQPELTKKLGGNARAQVKRDFSLSRYTQRLFTIAQSAMTNSRA